MIIRRTLAKKLKKSAATYPALAILGPRQSGKTTLAKAAFSQHKYLLLEDLDVRTFAQKDPREFLNVYKNEHGLILDEIQRVPDLLSYIQGEIDRNEIPGYFILTGSQNFLLNEAITQTLAGRISINTLLPFSIEELKHAGKLPDDVWSLIFQGSYPRIHMREFSPNEWYRDYIHTYLERDVRHIKQVTDLEQFQTFIKLCAGRIGQLVNYTSLANDTGISVNTAKSWLSLLKQSYVLFTLQPHHKNFSKRLVKSPKIYFFDTGLACALLKIDEPEKLITHYLKGGLFESFIICELLKRTYNIGKDPHLYFWRNQRGDEIDCIIETAEHLTPIEVKAASTISQNFFKNLTYWNELAKADPADGYVVYSGTENQKRSLANVIGWQSTPSIIDRLTSTTT